LTAPDTYVPVTLTYDGRDYGPVGVHLKGMQSWEPIDRKPSLHVNIDKFAPGAAFFGLKDLTLNNMHSDYSMMHERIAYWLARQAGVPASRANHALVTVNGQLYGLYANVETVKKRILSRVFGNDGGSLFSATDVDFEPQYVPTYELVAGPDDRTLLAGLAGALAALNPDDAIAAAAGYADVDQFTRFWALCAVVGQLDSFPYSTPGDDYFTYANPVTGRLAFMPWGIDESFYAGDIDVAAIHSVFAVQCKASPSCFQKFVDNVWDILALADRLDWRAEHDRVAAQIAPFVSMDARKWYTTEQVGMYQQDMWYFMADRRQALTAWIPGPSGAPATGVMPQR
jgi:spore coat protein CotH